MKKSKLFIQGSMVLAIILVVNLLSEVAYFRIDFTEDKRYTLGKATRSILEDLDDVITVKAYFTEDLPAQLGYIKDELRDQFIEYENRSEWKFCLRIHQSKHIGRVKARSHTKWDNTRVY